MQIAVSPNGKSSKSSDRPGRDPPVPDSSSATQGRSQLRAIRLGVVEVRQRSPPMPAVLIGSQCHLSPSQLHTPIAKMHADPPIPSPHPPTPKSASADKPAGWLTPLVNLRNQLRFFSDYFIPPPTGLDRSEEPLMPDIFPASRDADPALAISVQGVQ